jgi:hypothetical protein
MYAGENQDRFFTVKPATAGQLPNVQIALDVPNTAAAKTVGLVAEHPGGVWTCPKRPKLPIWEEASKQWVIGYQYFGGIPQWVNPAGSFPSRSPQKTSNSASDWVLAADTTMKINGTWGGQEPGRPEVYEGMPSHGPTGKAPEGGNQVHVDGSARWVKFKDMRFIHTWGVSSRQSFFYQRDLGAASNAPPALNYQ